MYGSVNAYVNLKNDQFDVVSENLPDYVTCLSSLLDAIGVKLIGPHGGLEVSKY